MTDEPDVPRKAKQIPLVEMFGPTMQGEGVMVGQQTYFLRFGLCDYKCRMCDSMHAVDPRQVKLNAKWGTQEDIFEAFTEFHKPNTTPWVTYSGGNPCIHDLTELTFLLKGAGFKIAVETQGTFAPDWLYDCDIVTVSPKPPGMGEELNLPKVDAFLDIMAAHTKMNMKVVIFDQRDIEVAAMLRERFKDYFAHDNFYLSLGNPYPPGLLVEEAEEPGFDLVSALIDRYKMLFQDVSQHPVLSQVKFLPQVHALLWGNEKGR